MNDTNKLIIEKGYQFHKDGDLSQAQENYEKALKSEPKNFNVLVLLGTLLGQKQSYEEALEKFDQAEEINNQNAELFYNRGIVLNALQRFKEAISNYNIAINLKPDFSNAFLNRGYTKSHIHLFKEAIADFSSVIDLNPDLEQAYFYRAQAYSKINEHQLAINDYEKIDEDKYHLLSQKMYEKLLICDWSDYEENVSKLKTKINQGEIIRNPFTPLLTLDDPELQLKTSKTLANQIYPENNVLGSITKYPKKEKIRIAYIASSFNQSSLTYLISGLFKFHDKKKFEVIGITFNSPQKDKVHKNIEVDLSQLIDLTGKSDIEIAKYCRNLELDIAIDLNGLSTDMRIGIFAYRIAPVQINFLGYPGTIGASYYDYIIADKTVIPEELKKFYTEKILYQPHSYFVNSHQALKIGESIQDNSSLDKLGLPHDAFIFCCFNNSYKITPEIFDSWVRILKKVENSVLWLIVKNDGTQMNLIKEAKARNLKSNRLIFTRFSSFNDYLSWFQYPDLFLDTFPYTSHTIATDALWMGLPIITKIGNSFSSRVCSSFLKVMGLEELITSSADNYENLAIDLAINSKKLSLLKAKLIKNKNIQSLFDTENYIRGFEVNLESLWK
jgi:protein O-GlcNAc transferase